MSNTSDRPPWAYLDDMENKQNGGQERAPQKVDPYDKPNKYDLNDALRHGQHEQIKKSVELADRGLQIALAEQRLLLDQLLTAINNDGQRFFHIHVHDRGGTSIERAEIANQFLKVKNKNAAGWQQILAALEALGISAARVGAFLQAETEQSKLAGSVVDFPARDVKFELGQNKKPKSSFANARAAIIGLHIECRYNVFSNRLLIGGRVIEQWAGEINDQTLVRLRQLIVDIRSRPCAHN
jgi:hypothetical protein